MNFANFDTWLKHDLLKIPVGASEHAHHMDDFMIYIHYLMVALFVIWMAYFVFAVFRFRQSAHPKADYTGVKSHASTWLELGVAVVEVVLLLGFAIPLWASAVDAEKFPAEKDSLVIRVIAEQFVWNVRYSGADAKFGKQDSKLIAPDNPFGVDKTDPASKDDMDAKEIHVPIGKPVIAHLTSKDVIHCFKVVPLRVTQDAIPGMSIPVHFKATRIGKYQITCAQLCGSGHATMKGSLIVESEADYKAWLAKVSKGTTATSFE